MNNYPPQPNDGPQPTQPYQQPTYPQSMPSMPTPPPPPQNRIQMPPPQKVPRRNWFFVGAAVLAICVVGLIAQQGKNGNTQANQSTPTVSQSTQSKPTEKPTQAKPTPTPKPLSTEDQAKKILNDNAALIKDKDPDVVYDKKSKHMLVMAYQGIGWDANDAANKVKMNCFGAQKALWQSNLSKTFTELQVQVFGPTTDKYGKEDPHGYVGFCKLSKETAGKFVWDNLTWNTAWDVYDDTWILG